MDKITLENNKANIRELAMLDRQIVKLYETLDNVPVVSGKVSASGEAFPYIEGHVTVQMAEPKAAEEVKRKIRGKELRKNQIKKEILDVESFVSNMPEGEDKRIFELTYLEGMKQREVADIVNLDRSRISRRISDYLKNAHKAQK